jgi:hypothetical protein
MKTRIFLLALLFAVCLTSWAWADGWIRGDVKYQNCTPHAQDIVNIKRVSDGVIVWTGNVIIQGGPHYFTYPYLIPPGTYQIWVDEHVGSDCTEPCPIVIFEYGSGNEECDIKACGPTPTPTNPDPGP